MTDFLTNDFNHDCSLQTQLNQSYFRNRNMLMWLVFCGEKIWVLLSVAFVLQYWDDSPIAPWPLPPPPSPLSPIVYRLILFYSQIQPYRVSHNIPTGLLLTFLNNRFCICFFLFALLFRRYPVLWFFRRPCLFLARALFPHKGAPAAFSTAKSFAPFVCNDSLFSFEKVNWIILRAPC